VNQANQSINKKKELKNFRYSLIVDESNQPIKEEKNRNKKVKDSIFRL